MLIGFLDVKPTLYNQACLYCCAHHQLCLVLYLKILPSGLRDCVLGPADMEQQLARCKVLAGAVIRMDKYLKRTGKGWSDTDLVPGETWRKDLLVKASDFSLAVRKNQLSLQAVEGLREQSSGRILLWAAVGACKLSVDVAALLMVGAAACTSLQRDAGTVPPCLTGWASLSPPQLSAFDAFLPAVLSALNTLRLYPALRHCDAICPVLHSFGYLCEEELTMMPAFTVCT